MIISDNDDDVANGETFEAGNPALADAMKKVLRIGKNVEKSSRILAKAKINTNADSSAKRLKKSSEFEISTDANNGASAPVKEEDSSDEIDVKPDKVLIRRKKAALSLGRLKPSPLDRERERPLAKIATRGVVQLFNAVKEQQKVISQKIDEAGPSERKKEKALKSVDKNSFLSVLRGCAAPRAKSTIKDDPQDEVKTEDENEQEPSWSVLRDDFMMGAKLKDWNKPTDDDVVEVAPTSGSKSKKAS